MSIKAVDLFPDARLKPFREVEVGSIFWVPYGDDALTYGIKCEPSHLLRHQFSALLFKGPEWNVQFCGLIQTTLVLAFSNPWRIQPNLSRLVQSGNSESDSGALLFSESGRYISCKLRTQSQVQESGFVSLDDFSLSPRIDYHGCPAVTEWEVFLCDQTGTALPTRIFKHASSTSAAP